MHFKAHKLLIQHYKAALNLDKDNTWTKYI